MCRIPAPAGGTIGRSRRRAWRRRYVRGLPVLARENGPSTGAARPRGGREVNEACGTPAFPGRTFREDGCVEELGREAASTEQNVEKIQHPSADGCCIHAAPRCGGVVFGGCRFSPRGDCHSIWCDSAGGTPKPPLSGGAGGHRPSTWFHLSTGSRHRRLDELRG